MPFSSSICLTNTGTLPLGSSVDIYSNSDSYSVPFQTNISLSLLTSNCPYILTNIPDGTTQIKFQDTVSHCCYNLALKDNNLCNLFGIQLSGFSASTISQIVSGVLVSSVGANITSYIIDWYGPDDNTVIAFTSGYGTAFNNIGYTQTHPFIRPSLPGYYAPMIRQIRINNINYSITGGTGFIQSNINCLGNQIVEVFPSSCSGNRNEPIGLYPEYDNYYFSNTTSNNTPPETLTLAFDLDINSNYFAWQFQPYSVSDTIKIIFHGDNYSTPIVLDYYTVGFDFTYTNILVTPKIVTVIPSYFFKKVINFSNFLRSENDFLIILVIPNVTNSRTDWSLYFKCLNTFNCSTCLDSSSPYKIIQSSLSITPLTCNQYKLQTNLSGCTSSQVNNSDLYKYFISNSGIYRPSPVTNNSFFGSITSYDGIIPLTTTESTGYTYCNNKGFYAPPYECSDINGSVSTFQKTNATVNGPGNIYMTFNSFLDFSVYYQSYLNILNTGLGTPFDNTDINYYRFFVLIIPIIPPNDLNRTCSADASNRASYNIHTSSVVTTGLTNNVYWINVTMPLITLGLTYSNCFLNCDNLLQAYINLVNDSSISAFNQYNFTSNVSAKITNPFHNYQGVSLSTQGATSSSLGAGIRLVEFGNNTVPMTDNTYIPIPSLSAQTCDLSTYRYSSTNGVGFYEKKAYSFYTTLTPPNNFTISSGPILIYEYNFSSNTVTYIDQSYFI